MPLIMCKTVFCLLSLACLVSALDLQHNRRRSTTTTTTGAIGPASASAPAFVELEPHSFRITSAVAQDDPLTQFVGRTDNEALARIDSVIKQFSDQKIGPELRRGALERAAGSGRGTGQTPVKRHPFAKKNCCLQRASKEKCAALGGIRSDAAVQHLDKRCLGAIGNDCSGHPNAKAGRIDEDHFVEVWVSVGSIAHDNCCLRYPFGQMCAPGVTARIPEDLKPWPDDECACTAEWRKYVQNLKESKMWRANVSEYSNMGLRRARPVTLDIYGWRKIKPEREPAATRRLRAPPGTRLDCPVGMLNCRVGRFPEGVRAGDSAFCSSGLFSRIAETRSGAGFGVCSHITKQVRLRRLRARRQRLLRRRNRVSANLAGSKNQTVSLNPFARDMSPFAKQRRVHERRRRSRGRDEANEVDEKFDPSVVPKTAAGQTKWLEILQEINDARAAFARRVAVLNDVKRAAGLSRKDLSIIARLELGRSLYVHSANKGAWPRALRLYYEGSRRSDVRLWRLLLARKLYHTSTDPLQWPTAVREYFQDWDRIEDARRKAAALRRLRARLQKQRRTKAALRRKAALLKKKHKNKLKKHGKKHPKKKGKKGNKKKHRKHKGKKHRKHKGKKHTKHKGKKHRKHKGKKHRKHKGKKHGKHKGNKKFRLAEPSQDENAEAQEEQHEQQLLNTLNNDDARKQFVAWIKAPSQSEQTTQPDHDASEQSEQTTQPHHDASEQSEQTTQPHRDASEQSEQTTQPHHDASEQSESATTTSESSVQDQVDPSSSEVAESAESSVETARTTSPTQSQSASPVLTTPALSVSPTLSPLKQSESVSEASHRTLAESTNSPAVKQPQAIPTPTQSQAKSTTQSQAKPTSVQSHTKPTHNSRLPAELERLIAVPAEERKRAAAQLVQLFSRDDEADRRMDQEMEHIADTVVA